MFQLHHFIAALAVAAFASHSHAQFASSVVAYDPGAGFAIDFGSGQGLTNAAAALGAPSRVTVDPDPMFGGEFPVDPFSPPYLREQVVSIGAGGSLTLELEHPARNRPLNPFGLDFILFGNAGFVITNGDFSGGGVTDGSLFGKAGGATRVSVSEDNVTYFELDPSAAPRVDEYFPTDGQGDFSKPVHPDLRPSDFSGAGLEAIRSLYEGAGGGAGFDLAWARDAAGEAASLSEIRFVRIEVLEGAAEVDAVSVVSEPPGGLVEERFSGDPSMNGWKVFGSSELFHWNDAEEWLEITWDSSRNNSYFYLPLGRSLSRRDPFRFAFDIRLDSVEIGLSEAKPYTFEVAAGLIGRAEAFSADFLRGAGFQSPNLVEWTYFPDSGFGATIAPTIVSEEGRFATSFSFPLEMPTGRWFRVELEFDPAGQRLATRMELEGAPFGPVKEVHVDGDFTDFNVDAFSINSYSDEGATGSLMARGVIDNVVVALPAPPLGELAIDRGSENWRVSFNGRLGWSYRLERSEDLKLWTPAGAEASGAAGRLTLEDDARNGARAFYRVRAERP